MTKQKVFGTHFKTFSIVNFNPFIKTPLIEKDLVVVGSYLQFSFIGNHLLNTTNQSFKISDFSSSTLDFQFHTFLNAI